MWKKLRAILMIMFSDKFFLYTYEDDREPFDLDPYGEPFISWSTNTKSHSFLRLVKSKIEEIEKEEQL